MRVIYVLPIASLSIGEVFSAPFLLNVPVYQRPYSWDREQAGQLLEDLSIAAGLEDGGETAPGYFLGTILLMDQSGLDLKRFSPRMPVREFDIVDGQQRLVTLMTMAAIIRDLDGAARSQIARQSSAMLMAQQGSRFFRTERFRLHLSSRDRDYFERHVLAPSSTLQTETSDVTPASDRNLADVRDLLLEQLRQLNTDARAKLYDFIVNRCHVVVILSNDIDNAHSLFVVLNERGKKLARNDILKADVLSRLPAEKISWAAEAWDKANSRLGENFEDFFSYIRSIFGYNRPQIISGVRAVVRDQGGAEPFLNKVFLPLAASYSAIKNADIENLPAEFRTHLAYLNRLSPRDNRGETRGDWVPAAMLVLRDWKTNPDVALEQLRAIDRLAHLLRLLCLGSGKRQRRFAAVVAALRENPALSPNHQVFEMSREEIKNIAYHLRDMHRRNPKMCKMLLLRLSEVMADMPPGLLPEHFTIEHVLPQRPSATSEWRRWFPSADERSRATESLGNLVLVSEKQNDRAKNEPFAEKKAIYAKPENGIAVLQTTEDVLRNDTWGRAEIEAREDRLFKLIENLWRIDLGSSRTPNRDLAQPAAREPVTQRVVTAGR